MCLHMKNKISFIAKQAFAAWEEVPDNLRLLVKGFEGLHWIHVKIKGEWELYSSFNDGFVFYFS